MWGEGKEEQSHEVKERRADFLHRFNERHGGSWFGPLVSHFRFFSFGGGGDLCVFVVVFPFFPIVFFCFLLSESERERERAARGSTGSVGAQ